MSREGMFHVQTICCVFLEATLLLNCSGSFQLFLLKVRNTLEKMIFNGVWR